MAKPKGGARPGAGTPGYGKQLAVREGVERLTPRWFAMIEDMLDMRIPKVSEADSPIYYSVLVKSAKEDRKFALDQLGRLMAKLMPTEITGKNGAPIAMNINLESATTDELLRFLTAASANNIRVSG